MIAKTIQGIAKSPLIQTLKEKNRSKIIIYPNWNGVGLGFFVFLCFLIAVFYENNFGLLLSIIIFFIFFISIFVSNQNLNHLSINALDNYYLCYTLYIKRKHLIWKKTVSYINNIFSSFLFNKSYKIYLSSFRGFRSKLLPSMLKNQKKVIFIDSLLINSKNSAINLSDSES